SVDRALGPSSSRYWRRPGRSGRRNRLSHPLRRLRRRRGWRRLVLNSARTTAGRPGDRREGLDQFADRKGEVEEFGIGKLGIDERDRPPRRLGEAIELHFAEPR